MFPMIPALFYFMAWGLSRVEIGWKLREDFCAGVLLIVAAASAGNVYSDEHTYPFDLSELTRKIREDGGLRNGGCLLLLDHYWIWTRGEMMIGAPIRYFEVSSSHRQPLDPGRASVRLCDFASGSGALVQSTGARNWQHIAEDNHGQMLMKRLSN